MQAINFSFGYHTLARKATRERNCQQTDSMERNELLDPNDLYGTISDDTVSSMSDKC